MNVRWRMGVGGVLILLALAGCNFSAGNEEKPFRPTLGSPIAWATAHVVTATLSGTNLPTPEPTATSTPFIFPTFASPTATVEPLLTAAPPPTLTPVPPATLTAAPPLTLTPVPPATLTAAPSIPAAQVSLPTLTSTPYDFFTATLAPPPSFTPFGFIPTIEAPVPTMPPPQPTSIPVLTAAPPPSFTPVLFSTQPPLPTNAPSAQVCATCSQLRLRDGPGTAGNITSLLDANTALTIIGRTGDNAWVQVVLADGRNGWVAAQYLTVNVDLNVVSVTEIGRAHV